MLVLDDNIKIVHQSIDTLVIGCKCHDEISYNKIFKPFVEKVKYLKGEAKELSTFGNKFVKDTLDLGLGNFLVSSSGRSTYFGYVENNDVFFYVGDVPYDSKLTYHIKLQFRSVFLLKMGYQKAYYFASLLLGRILGNFTTKVLRVDLCADLYGIRYTQSDIINFRTKKKKTLYKDLYTYNEIKETENIEHLKISEYSRYNKFQGIQFGKSPFMFRIYDKTKEIKGKLNGSYLIETWKKNGYDISTNYPIYRHEVEFQRDYLRTMFPDGVDEIDFLFSNLLNFWNNGISLLEWVNLTDKEHSKISKQLIEPQSITKIYRRALEDTSRFTHWHILEQWHDTNGISLDKIPDIKKRDFIHCEKSLKVFVSSVFRHVGSHPDNLAYVVNEVVRKMENEGTSLYNYALSRLASSFLDNYKNIEKLGYSVTNDFDFSARQSIPEFIKALKEIKEPTVKTPIERALEVLKYEK